MTYARHMFPPVDTSRRGFLTRAGAFAAGGAALAVGAAVGAPEAVAAVPAPADDVHRFLIELNAEIDENLTALIDIDADFKMRDRAVEEWERRNPIPGHPLPDGDGYSPTARSDWHTHKQNAMQAAWLGKVKGRRNELPTAYREAVDEFASIKAANVSELMLKVETGVMMDSADSSIARSVLFDLVRLKWPLVSL